ncbi:hypothetical protein HELRODRAFT_166503 [Helobdella robusta]|uniref:Nitrogen permease regulator 2-like protein n=1 Tax=Helobdella robusta TaxID=6412 RepID=T1EY67_HELRO|nr:hypothetical protein HELRODRAFT_166503 [Helobdella robusta]ESO11500.1 hypothetical protein HELRODRAFT_166503 [Helobdella robusta]
MASVVASSGKIESIFFSMFHLTEGPKIVLQVPEEIITKETFLSHLHKYVIPKKQLYRRVIRLHSQGHMIIGYPILVEGEQFERNEIRFNCCFVLNSHSDGNNYENVVRKVNLYLEHETFHGFLLNEKNKENITKLLTTVFNDLNKYGRCNYIGKANSSTLHLQIDAVTDEKVVVNNYDVPVFRCSSSPSLLQSCLLAHADLVAKKIIPLINGEWSVTRIGHEADISVDIVKDCIKKLVYHGALLLVPLFQYSNTYVVTPKIHELYNDASFQERCIRHSSITNKRATFNDIFIFYTSMGPTSRLKDACLRLNPRSKNIDEKKLIQFGLVEGLVRRLQKYPLKLVDDQNMEDKRSDAMEECMNGSNSYDEICGRFNLAFQELDERVENNPDVVVYWK